MKTIYWNVSEWDSVSGVLLIIKRSLIPTFKINGKSYKYEMSTILKFVTNAISGTSF